MPEARIVRPSRERQESQTRILRMAYMLRTEDEETIGPRLDLSQPDLAEREDEPEE
jgi:hypothetical protein